ncbi:hypothetical protein MELA_01665 [Candidatus Methylomirabilis lanthanidiphila]|uniref:DUF4399 domain-containing protein n=1 Tax=Candidatus Methylomirabilis lanthanidiphila TaxID=2211376 RepID=A0A564ZJD7_9BACT|nr:DUF4399 domain-containing protein [Candidatus Methylomirabilis lanthanidiphila]VUZ85283.1 hypothetical protein MELA_01665 [Candidatus Methylomirabilis lanthanidiphila]
MNGSKHTSRSEFTLALLLLVAGLSACATIGATSQARVFFTSPSDGATVASPVKVTMGTENFIVEPAGTVKARAGHLHIMVDTDCVPAGQVVPFDDAHRHYGKGQLEAELALSPGTHTLCLQAADGAHIALAGAGMTQKITLTVK